MKETSTCYKLLSMMADDDEAIFDELFVYHNKDITEALEAESVFPTTVNQLHTLKNGHKYVTTSYLENKYDSPMFNNYDYHLLIEGEADTGLATRLTRSNPTDLIDEGHSFHSFHSFGTTKRTDTELNTAQKTNKQKSTENSVKQSDFEADITPETNETNETNENVKPYMLLYASSALNDYRNAHAGNRQAAVWIGEMAMLPPGRYFNYWFAKNGGLVCLVKDSGVFFGHAEEGGHLLVLDTYATLAEVQLPQPLLSSRLDEYRDLVNGLCGRVAMDDVFYKENCVCDDKLTDETKRKIMQLLEPAKRLMVKNASIGWDELWKRILGDNLIAAQLTNTSHVKYKAYNQPQLATLVCQLQRRGILEQYEAKTLAIEMGFNEDDSFRQFLGQLPNKNIICKALDDILTGFRL